MAKMKLEVMRLENHGFLVNRVNTETGQISDSEKFDAEKVLDHKTIGRVLDLEQKGRETRRQVWQSLLAEVFKLSMLEGWRNKGDRKSGKIPKEYKASVRDAETKVLSTLVEEGAIKLSVPKDGNKEQVFQALCTGVREDKNYSNIKSTVTRYFFFVGGTPATASGYLVPAVVMMAEYTNAIEKEKVQATVATDLKGIVERIKERKENPDAVTVKEALRLAGELVQILNGLKQFYAELATNARVGPDSSLLAKDAIAQAQSMTPKKPTAMAQAMEAVIKQTKDDMAIKDTKV